jgi:peptide-methionine (R)-S-oxide reductase
MPIIKDDQDLPKTEEEWKKILTPEEYRVLREKGTDRAFANKYDHEFSDGMYRCAACGAELFDSKAKYDSGCGWPAFFAAAAGDRVKFRDDSTLGMQRIEVTCSRCGSHLGHIFDDGPSEHGGKRFCINSTSIDLAKK